jgi:ubiquinone/menaquinone biosynthesis C-methylase UbiE
MDLEAVGEQLKVAYRNVTPRYRLDDEIEVGSPNHRRLWRMLRGICLSFPFPIAVLDAGCGTGRYFHCLENVEGLIGIDVSPDMLHEAERPVMKEQISAERTELVCENIFRALFPPNSFHLIYSLGMFGNGCPVTPEIVGRFFNWLQPGGKLFFDVLSVGSLPLRVKLRRAARRLAYPWLPSPVKRRLDQREARLPLFALTKSDLEEIMLLSRFKDFHISKQDCDSPLWDGKHLECLAIKQ